MADITIQTKINKNAEEQLKELMLNKLLKISENVVASAKEKVPVKTGKLKASIDILNIDRETNEAIVGTQNTGYGLYVEMGTSKALAQPFLRPALDENIVRKIE